MRTLKGEDMFCVHRNYCLKLLFSSTVFVAFSINARISSFRCVTDNCAQPAVFYVRGCDCCDVAVGFCQSHDSLLELDLSYEDVTDEELNKILFYCPQLRSIKLACCSMLKFALPISWPSTLRVIDVSDTSIMDDSLLQIFTCCSMLEELNISSCDYIQFQKINTWPLGLKQLNVYWNAYFNKEVLLALCCQCLELEKLDICSCFNLIIDDEVCQKLIGHHTLKSLDLNTSCKSSPEHIQLLKLLID
jgi:hypothetical protein